jgi:hypothetical protein
LLVQPGEHTLFFPACVWVTGDESPAQGQMITKRYERYELTDLLLSCAYLPCIQAWMQKPGT